MKFWISSLFFALAIPSIGLAQSVDILWEGETYTPPFYEGASLWGAQSMIKLVAIPQGINEVVSYVWSRNGTVLGSLSGPERNSLRVEDSIFSKTQSIRVELRNSAGKTIVENSINIAPVAQEVWVYENHPTLGYLFNQAASNSYTIRADEINLASFPIHFSVRSKEDPSINFSWRSNAREDGQNNSVTYRVPEGESGQTSIRSRIALPQYLKQTAEKNFLIQFGNSNEN